MEIKVLNRQKSVTFVVSGQINTLTAPELEASFDKELKDNTNVIVDFSNVTYISSAGLRVLLVMEKKMISIHGSLSIINSSEEVKEIFKLTGFDEMLGIK